MTFEPDHGAPLEAGFEPLMALLRLIASPKDYQRQLDALMAASTRMREEAVGADRARAALAEREKEIAAAQAVLDEREAEQATLNDRWRERNAALDAREAAVSETGVLAEIRQIRSAVTKHENWLRAQLMQIAGMSARYSSLLNDMPGFSGVIDEILHDHGIAPDGAASERIASPTADETVFQNNLPMSTPDVASGKSPRHRAEPRV